MKRKRRGVVDTQTLSDVSGDINSYETWISEHGETCQNNPDLLAEQSTKPSNPQLLMGEAIEHLQGRQREVYLLIMREGRTERDTAAILGISKTVVHTYITRAIKFITAYCKQGIDGGRI